MSVEEYDQRIAELQNEIREIDDQYTGVALPDPERERWNRLNEELEQTVATRDEVHQRMERLRMFAQNPAALEPGADLGSESWFQVSRPGSTRGQDIYDLSTIRASVTDPDEAVLELRSRALHSIEAAVFPTDRKSREACQDRLSSLVESCDTGGTIATRILRTGSPVYRRAWRKTLFGQALTSEESRAFGVGTTGIPIPYTLDPTLIHISNSVVNPMRAISKKVTISGSNQWLGATSTAITATRIAEGTEATDNTPTLTQPSVTVTKAHAFVPFSVEVEGDWPDMESELTSLFADAKDDEEATAFVNGAGTGVNPQGIVTGTTGTVAASTGLTITAANLYALEAALPPRFRPRAQFLANRAMYNIIRALDTAGGAQLWLRIGDLIQNDPASSGGVGNTGLRLLGYPVNEVSTMAATVTNGTKQMILGDTSYFVIVDRVGMNVELVPQIFGATSRFPIGQRGMYAWWRNSSLLLTAAATRALTGTT
jgi:HK97 family phage major capsid protein